MTDRLLEERSHAEGSTVLTSVERMCASLRSLAESCDELARSFGPSAPELASQLPRVSHCLHEALAILGDLADRGQRTP